MLSIYQTPVSIELTVGDSNTPLPIQRKRTDEASRTLGCYLAPDSDTKDEENILWNKGLHYGAVQRKIGTIKVEAYYKYMSYINPGMSYPMPLSNISHTTLTNIQCPYLRPTKQQMGFRGTIADAFMHAPRAYLGVDLPALPVTRDLLHLRMLCGHIHEDSETKAVLMATLSGFQLTTGLKTPVL
jgi:hypothetical protein